MNKFWLDRRTGDGNYTCPTNGCGRDLKVKLSNSAANPGRSFVSCDQKFDGCGRFCFVDEAPNPKFEKKLESQAKGSGTKRERTEDASDGGSGGNSKNFRAEGTSITGQVAYPPSATDARVADLANEVATLRQIVLAVQEQLTVACAYIKETTDH